MRHPRRHALGGDGGFSLVELTVAMALLVILITATLTLVVASREVFVSADDEATGQTDVRTAVERLGKDIRSSRGIATGATASRLEVWIDYDSDYKQDTDEIVGWQLQANGSGQFDVRRSADGTSTITAETIIDQLAFCYRVSATTPCLTIPVGGLTAADAAKIRVVETTMKYDAKAQAGVGTSARNLKVVERLRNVG